MKPTGKGHCNSPRRALFKIGCVSHGGGDDPRASEAERAGKAQVGISQQLERLTEAYLMAIIPLAEYQRRRSELEQKSQDWRLKRRNWRPKSIGKLSWFSWVHRSRISVAESIPVWSTPRLTRNA